MLSLLCFEMKNGFFSVGIIRIESKFSIPSAELYVAENAETVVLENTISAFIESNFFIIRICDIATKDLETFKSVKRWCDFLESQDWKSIWI